MSTWGNISSNEQIQTSLRSQNHCMLLEEEPLHVVGGRTLACFWRKACQFLFGDLLQEDERNVFFRTQVTKCSIESEKIFLSQQEYQCPPFSCQWFQQHPWCELCHSYDWHYPQWGLLSFLDRESPSVRGNMADTG